MGAAMLRRLPIFLLLLAAFFPAALQAQDRPKSYISWPDAMIRTTMLPGRSFPDTFGVLFVQQGASTPTGCDPAGDPGQKIFWKTGASNGLYQCLTLNTWTQVGVGSVSGSGTTNSIPKWTAATALGDSLFTDDGTTGIYGGAGGFSASKYAATGSGAGISMWGQGTANTCTLANAVCIMAPASVPASYAQTWPSALPASAQLIQVSSTGVWSFSGVPPPASGTSGGVPYFNSTTSMLSSGLLTLNGILLGGGVGAAPTSTAALTNGQLCIGSTGNPCVPAALTQGANVTITNGAGTITIASTGAGAIGASVGNITPVTANASVTTAQILMDISLPTGYFNTLASGGGNFLFHASGIFSVAATPTVTHTGKICTSAAGGGTCVTLYTITSPASVTAASNQYNINVKCGTSATGTTGTLICHGPAVNQLTTGTATDVVTNDANTAVSATFDLTIAQFYSEYVTFSTASASNTMTQQLGYVGPLGGGTACSGITNAVCNNTTNTGAAGMTLNRSASTNVNGDVVPGIAGAAPTANGAGAFDTTQLTPVRGYAGTTDLGSGTLSVGRPLSALTNSVTSDQDFATLYTIPANLLIANRVLRITILFQTVTGANNATQGYYLKLGTTKVYTQSSASAPGASFTRNWELVFDVWGTAAAGASVATETAMVFPGTTGNMSTSNSTTQPVNLATNGTLAITPGITFGATGSTDTVTLRTYKVEVFN